MTGNSHKLNFREYGKGPIITLLHGWGMNSTVWKPVIPYLEKRFRLQLIDLPGHGFNQQVKAASLSSIVTQVIQVLPQQTHLLGWSLGGLVAQCVSREAIGQIRSLTVVAGTPRFSQTGDWPHGIGSDLLERFSAGLEKDIEGTLRRFVALQFLGSNSEPDSTATDIKTIQRKLVRELVSQLPHRQALETGLEILQHADLRRRHLNQSTADSGPILPVHWILGERDRLIPSSLAKALASFYPDDRVTLIEQAGHAPFLTHPATFSSRVSQFLESLSPTEHTK